MRTSTEDGRIADVRGRPTITSSADHPIERFSAVLCLLVESGEQQATDKLMQIARADENRAIRRKAIAAPGRSSDER